MERRTWSNTMKQSYQGHHSIDTIDMVPLALFFYIVYEQIFNSLTFFVIFCLTWGDNCYLFLELCLFSCHTQGLEQCVDLGLTKSIGISNFNSKQLQRLLDNCRIVPANIQVELLDIQSNTNRNTDSEIVVLNILLLDIYR